MSWIQQELWKGYHTNLADKVSPDLFTKQHYCCDLNGDGQRKAKHAASACNATVALPPVFGDGTTP
ncbi:hypothetical protein [uncultured Acinetobacter sp.]|uniref:hypothetical protein n=1 Tax=uncultured Acinetobacter sp. TaxID=165433 RepID=UPI002588FC72|nr:hypothetical protein [uncultured Acinetobacter sp.]